MKTRSLPKRAIVEFGLAALATLVFVLLMEVVLEGHADAFDQRWALWIHHHVATPVLTWLLIGVTYLGSNWAIVPIVAVLAIVLYRQHHWRTGLIIACDVLVAEVLNRLLKAYVERPRPTLFSEITRPETWSFPSGHAMTAMAVYGGLGAVFITLYPSRRLPIVIATAVWIFLIGFSRVYLGVHWPTDVVAGWAAGVPLLIVTVRLLHRKDQLKIGRRDNEMNVYSSP